MEKYTASTRFCLICNHVGKIIPALQSRCTKFRFAPLQPEQVLGRLRAVCAAEHVDVSADGERALLTLARGDMRKVLNTLQATVMAYGTVSEESVYATTATPLPQDVRALLDALLNEELAAALDKVVALKQRKGVALADLLRDLHALVAASALDDAALGPLYIALSRIEHRLARGASERLQTTALVAAFQHVRRHAATVAAR